MQFPKIRAGLGAASLAALAIAGSPQGVSAAPKEVGVWIDNSGDGAVKIEPCGDKLCGHIVWLRNPLNDQGVAKHDRYNPDESRRNRPICGLPVLGDLSAVPEGGFDNGWVYDPKEGKSYSVAIVADGANVLSVTGYKGVKFLGKTFTWTRAKGDLPSCNAQPASAKPNSDSAAVGAAGAGAVAAKQKKMPAAETVAAEPAPLAEQAVETEAAPAPKGETAARGAKVEKQPSPNAAPDALTKKPAAQTKTKPKEAAATASEPKPAKPKAQAQTDKSAATNAEAPAKASDSKKKVLTKSAKPAKEAGSGKEVLPWSTGQ